MSKTYWSRLSVLRFVAICVLLLSQIAPSRLYAQSSTEEPNRQIFLPFISSEEDNDFLSGQLPADELNFAPEVRAESDDFAEDVIQAANASAAVQPTKQQIDDFVRATGEFPNSDYPLFTRPNHCGEGDIPVPNGWYYVDFRGACDRHDACYSTLGNSRQACDDQFLRDLRSAVDSGLNQPTRNIKNLPFVNPLFPIPHMLVTGLFSGTYEPTPEDKLIYQISGIAAPRPTPLWGIWMLIPQGSPTINPASLAQGYAIAEVYYAAVRGRGQPYFDSGQTQAAKYKALVDSYVNFYNGSTVVKEVAGVDVPQPHPGAGLGEVINNGDFSIVDTDGKSATLGDGFDEETRWTFDFSGDIRFVSHVSKAELELDLIPKNTLIRNDEVAIVGLARIDTPAIQGLSVGVKKTVTVDLLDFYDSSDIARAFNNNSGRIHMFFRDDAIVSRARLSLSVRSGFESSPEQCNESPLGSRVHNGGFEEGSSIWRFYTDGTGAFSTDSDSYKCNMAGRIIIDGEGNNVQIYQPGIALLPHTTYRLRLVARTDSNNREPRDVFIYLHKHGEPYTNYGLKAAKIDLTQDWKAFSIEFTTSGFVFPVFDARLRIWLAPPAEKGDEYWFDDIVMQRTSILPGVP